MAKKESNPEIVSNTSEKPKDKKKEKLEEPETNGLPNMDFKKLLGCGG
ncbi:MAG: hypothetical protein RIA69_07625 [Cyclobacteriaceae bacterium]